MAVRIRLTRMGKKKKPFYRVVVAASTSPRDGKTLEVVGFYDPTREPVYVEFKKERVEHWLSVGAQPSDTAQRLLSQQGLLESVSRKSAHQGITKKQLKEQSSK